MGHHFYNGSLPVGHQLGVPLGNSCKRKFLQEIQEHFIIANPGNYRKIYESTDCFFCGSTASIFTKSNQYCQECYEQFIK